MVNCNTAPNLKGPEDNYLIAKTGIKSAYTQNLTKTKGNNISPIVNGIPDYLKKFPSLTHRKDESTKNKMHQRKSWSTRTVNSSDRVKNKVLLIGDSNARNCAPKLQDNLSCEFLISSFVKPGANVSEVTNTVKEELQSLKSDDCCNMGRS